MNHSPALSTQNRHGFTYRLSRFGEAFVDYAAQASHPVADIGAAFGVATIPALANGARVYAVDITADHLEQLAENTPVELWHRLQLLQGRFPGLNFEPASLSAVYLSQVLPFLTGDEIEEGARKLWDWLVPGGKVFVVSFTPYIRHVASFIPVYEERLAAGIPWAGYIDDLAQFSSEPEIYSKLPNQINHVDETDLRRTFTAAGFIIEELTVFGDEEGALPPGIRYDNRERVGMIARKP